MTDYRNDERILLALKGGDENQLASLYHTYKDAFVAFIIQNFQCDPIRANDIYPECMSELYFNIRKGRLAAPLRSSLKTYLFTVGKFVYHRRYLDKFHRSMDAYKESPIHEDVYEHGDTNMLKKERAESIKSVLNVLGDPCKTLLERLYFDRYSYEALATEFNASEGSLRKRKFDCLKKFRRVLAELNIEL